jgi:hypothetical protein
VACAALCSVALGCSSKAEDHVLGDGPGAGPGIQGSAAGTTAADPGAGGGSPPPSSTAGSSAGAAGSPSSTGGNPAIDPGGSAGSTADPMVDDPTGGGDELWPDPRGGCPELNTRFPGDDACIKPPAPEEGFQIHIGPADYDDAADVEQFVLPLGGESSLCWSYHTPNETEVQYQGFVFSGRPGTHHVFNSMLANEVQDGGGFHVCVDAGLGNSSGRIGGLPGAGRPYVARTKVAPENEGLAGVIPPRVPAEADMHYFNATDGEILREFWLNIYYIDPSKVTDTIKGIRGMGGIGWAVLPIPANADQVYKYECPLTSTGRIISMQGHFHSHGVRESAWIRRGDGTRVPIFEMYDYANQASFQFDSITTNPPYTGTADFGYTGILEITAGDVLEWECHVKNGATPLRYTNSVEDGEMCNIFGGFVGDPAIESCLLP